MSKLCMKNREIKRVALVSKYARKRADLKAILSNQNKTVEEHQQARVALQGIPRNANPTRLRNRCSITGRSRGTFRQFGLARHKVREISFRGEAPGMMKSSW